ncbi:MAG: response regulator [Actinomycetota bacterium]
MRAMIVDDFRTARVVATRVARQADLTVELEAESGEQALSILAQLDGPPPELMLIDRYMSGMDGIELVERIRQDPTFADTALVIVSADAAQEAVAAALDAGADDYLFKPFDVASLTATLANLGLVPANQAR